MDESHADFTMFYRRHAPDVFRFALYLAHDRNVAEEITSDTFVRVWLSESTVREATVTAYLFTIARNIWLQSLSHERKHQELEIHLMDQRPDPYEQAATRSDLAALSERIMTLPDVDRRAFLMRVVDGMAYDEIATTLSISVSSAKVKIHRTRLLLANVT